MSRTFWIGVVLVLVFVLANLGQGRAGTEDKLESRVNVLEDAIRQMDSRLKRLEAAPQPTISIPPGKASWRQLRKEMTFDQVRAFLGEPGKIATYTSFIVWYYPSPGNGEVTFSPDGRVTGWIEP